MNFALAKYVSIRANADCRVVGGRIAKTLVKRVCGVAACDFNYSVKMVAQGTVLAFVFKFDAFFSKLVVQASEAIAIAGDGVGTG